MEKKKHKFYWEEPEKASMAMPPVAKPVSILHGKPLGIRFSLHLPRMVESKSDISIKEAGDKIIATAMLPGFSKDDISTEIRKGYIKIVAEKKKMEKGSREGMAFSMSSSQSVVRTASLPAEVNAESASKNFSNGILTVIMTKSRKKGFRLFGKN